MTDNPQEQSQQQENNQDQVQDQVQDQAQVDTSTAPEKTPKTTGELASIMFDYCTSVIVGDYGIEIADAKYNIEPPTTGIDPKTGKAVNLPETVVYRIDLLGDYPVDIPVDSNYLKAAEDDETTKAVASAALIAHLACTTLNEAQNRLKDKK